MENLLSTLVFILPGFMLYFWIQMIGINPVVKHTTIEFGALAALAWIPVIFITLKIMSLFTPITWTLDGINDSANSLIFICFFLLLSLIVSFLIACIYAWLLYPVQMWVVNLVRNLVGKAKLSNSASVWEEVFLQDDTQIVGVSKIGSINPDIIGCIEKVSRPFEPKRSLKLIYLDHCKMIVEEYKVPISDVFTDIDSGTHIFIYDQEKFNKADEDYRRNKNKEAESIKESASDGETIS